MSDEIKIELIKDDSTENCIRISCRNLIVVDNSLHAAIEKFDTKLERRLRLGWDQAERIEKSMQQRTTKMESLTNSCRRTMTE